MPSRIPRHDPVDCLTDIVDNAERIARYLEGMDRVAFGADERTRDAVERCVERVCEAVYRLADSAEKLMPGHPWADIRSTGNRLRHAYDRIDANIIWTAACHEVPVLAADAGRALTRLEAERDGRN